MRAAGERHGAGAARIRLIVRSVTAAATCIALAGCSALGTDGTIRAGTEVERVVPDRDFQVAPAGPRVDAEPSEIVRGFFQALTGSDGDFVTAREFLTGTAVRNWSAEGQTVVFEGLPEVREMSAADLAAEAAQADADSAADADASDAETGTETTTETATATTTETPPPDPATVAGPDEHTIRVSISAWAEVARDGHYTELPAAEPRSTDLILAEVGGQWRIRYIDPSVGRWLGTADFERLYDAYAVHYVSTGERLLIPDIRYIPTDRTATRLAQLQLGATPTYLLGAVRHDIPSTAQLAIGAVPVIDGVATVDLRGEGIGVDPTARTNLWAQFFATLTQVRGVEQVQITLEGTPIEVAGVDEVRSLSDLDFASPASTTREPPLIRQGPLLGQGSLRPRTDASQATPPALQRNTQGFPPIEEEWANLAMSFAADELAGTNGAALSRWRGNQQFDVPYFAEDLGRPCYDSSDVLWVGGVGTLSGDRLFSINAAASPGDPLRSLAEPVVVTWLADRHVHSCHLSPQGTRIAIISDGGEGTPARLDIGAVTRRQNGLPISVVGPQPVGAQFENVVDAVWLSETSLAVLADEQVAADPSQEDPPTDPDEPLSGPQPFLLTVGGRSTPLPTVTGAESITSTGGERNLVIGAADDTLLVRVGPQWLPAQEPGSQVIVGAR